jgi:hypothetical protein
VHVLTSTTHQGGGGGGGGESERGEGGGGGGGRGRGKRGGGGTWVQLYYIAVHACMCAGGNNRHGSDIYVLRFRGTLHQPSASDTENCCYDLKTALTFTQLHGGIPSLVKDQDILPATEPSIGKLQPRMHHNFLARFP